MFEQNLKALFLTCHTSVRYKSGMYVRSFFVNVYQNMRIPDLTLHNAVFISILLFLRQLYQFVAIQMILDMF